MHVVAHSGATQLVLPARAAVPATVVRALVSSAGTLVLVLLSQLLIARSGTRTR